jgi:hypothetical protein
VPELDARPTSPKPFEVLRVIEVPAAADIPLTELAAQLRAQGFSIETVNAEFLRAHAPPSSNAGFLDVARWTRGATLVIERSSSGITIRTRPPVMQLAITSLLMGLLSSGLVARTLPAVAIASVVIGAVSFFSMYASVRRRSTAFTLRPTKDMPEDVSASRRAP